MIVRLSFCSFGTSLLHSQVEFIQIFFTIFRQEKIIVPSVPGENSGQVTEATCSQFTTTYTLLYQQSDLTLVLRTSFPVLMKSALLLVGNVMEKMTVGIILMKMDVVSKYYVKDVSDQVEPD